MIDVIDDLEIFDMDFWCVNEIAHGFRFLEQQPQSRSKFNLKSNERSYKMKNNRKNFIQKLRTHKRHKRHANA